MKKAIMILSVIASITIICAIVLFFNEQKQRQFVIPEVEENVVKGVPEVDDEYKYSPIELMDGYVVSLAGHPQVKDNKLYLYFTSYEENKVLFRLKVYADDREIGSTGIIEPGTYLEAITLMEEKITGSILLKVMGYEKDTYESAGAFSLYLKV